MLIGKERQDTLNRKQAYSIAVQGAEVEAERRKKAKARDKLKKDNAKILSTFKMFYGRNFSTIEWEEMMKKFTCPREAKGVVEKLARELENKGLHKEKWLELAAKMFL